MERKRIENIDEIWDGHNLLIKDFSNLDLSNIDLSIIPEDKWKKCTFCNTNLNNTNIRFPNENWIYIKIDYKTIMANPDLKLPSIYISAAIYYDFLSMHYYEFKELNEDVKSKMIFDCENMIKYDWQGYLKKFYNSIKDNLNIDDKFLFFVFNEVSNQQFRDIYIDSDRLKFFSYYSFTACSFENIIVDSSLLDILRITNGGSSDILQDYRKPKNKYKNIAMPKVGYSDWKSVYYGKRYVPTSLISFTTKIYLELSRICNARCPFCRNQTFNTTDYDLDQIINTLHSIYYLIKTVVIGGGEPTLRINDVYRLITETKDNIEWHLFSNGTNKEVLNEDFIVNNCKINISRHAVDEDLNSNIFHVKRNTIMTLDDIAKLNEKTEVTLNATCFKGGLDSYDKIMEYIKISKKIGIKKVLIQNLQKNLALGQKDFNYNGLYIDDNLFDEIIAKFNHSNFHKRYPICSTSGYLTYIFKDDDGFQVAIQKYIDEKELEKYWLTAIKRVYDLSIDPLGNLYETWGQGENKVNIKMLKR